MLRSIRPLEWVLVSFLVVFIGGFFRMTFFPQSACGCSAKIPRCLSNVKQLSLGMILYGNDFEDHLPFANRWMDGIAPYVKEPSTFHCPMVPKDKPEEYGYAMRSLLSRLLPEKIAEPSKMAMVFDSTLMSRNANTNQVADPAFSRRTYQNVGYADGHAKALKFGPGEK